MILLSLLFVNFAFAQDLLKEGIYSMGNADGNCDMQVLPGRLANQLNVIMISNQASRIYCSDEGRALQFTCENDSCTGPNDLKLELLNSENFSFRSYRYAFVSKRAPLPATKFSSWGSFGFPAGTRAEAWSSSNQTCYIKSSWGTVRCNDTAYARSEFCPRASALLKDASSCEAKTGRRCTTTVTSEEIKSRVDAINYDRDTGKWKYRVQLECRVTGLTEAQ